MMLPAWEPFSSPDIDQCDHAFLTVSYWFVEMGTVHLFNLQTGLDSNESVNIHTQQKKWDNGISFWFKTELKKMIQLVYFVKELYIPINVYLFFIFLLFYSY